MSNTVNLTDDELRQLVSILSEYQMRTGEDLEDLVEKFKAHQRDPESVYSTSLEPPDR
ncbi:hypothetical protein [Haladaptatus halobius]|uniref:hypothetical protein n=1 Tax=Haladaptatus halobius TaxID=2884875 RepID=UPI001D0AE6A5|nr:hypothetical protein [Haladaptatus halobius]